jgi:hypothetical protein
MTIDCAVAKRTRILSDELLSWTEPIALSAISKLTHLEEPKLALSF